jgi:hypothetical protein
MHITSPINELNNTRIEELKINLNGENIFKPSSKDEDSKVSHTLGQPNKPKTENSRKRFYSCHLLPPNLPPSLINLEEPPSDGINENNENNEDKSVEKPEVLVKR